MHGLVAHFPATSANILRLTIRPGGDDAPGKLTLAGNAAEVGDNTSEHDAAIRGKVALNVTFLAEGISAIATPTIAIHSAASSSRSPCGHR